MFTKVSTKHGSVTAHELLEMCTTQETDCLKHRRRRAFAGLSLPCHPTSSYCGEQSKQRQGLVSRFCACSPSSSKGLQILAGTGPGNITRGGAETEHFSALSLVSQREFEDYHEIPQSPESVVHIKWVCTICKTPRQVVVDSRYSSKVRSTWYDLMYCIMYQAIN